MPSDVTVHLTPHPADAPSPLRGIEVCVRRDGATLHLRFRLTGALAHVRVPPLATPAFTLGLWEHTCAEAFVAAEGADPYHELNLSPSGEWAVFAFSDYRTPAGLLNEVESPRLIRRDQPDALDLEIALALDALAATYAGTALRLGLSAVVEADDDSRSFWSLVHPRSYPDFHLPATRVLDLPAPENR